MQSKIANMDEDQSQIEYFSSWPKGHVPIEEKKQE
jgi:hypothetical protein